MDFSLIIRPLIGAGIGYFTNWLAVKMLFRPFKPIMLGKLKLPFTPGIIPKNKERLADSIGYSISHNLLNEETLKETLLSNDMKNKIQEKLVEILNNSTQNTDTIKSLISKYISEESYTISIENIVSFLSNNIHDTVKKSNLGDLVAEQIKISAKESFKSSVLGLLGGNALVTSVANTASLKINYYIEHNGYEMISNMVNQEIEKYSATSISEITTSIGNSNIDLINILMNIYNNLVVTYLPTVIETLNISNIIKNKINEMDILELEEIILSIMKKELNALVNLGAIIGFILGLLNLLF